MKKVVTHEIIETLQLANYDTSSDKHLVKTEGHPPCCLIPNTWSRPVPTSENGYSRTNILRSGHVQRFNRYIYLDPPKYLRKWDMTP